LRRSVYPNYVVNEEGNCSIILTSPHGGEGDLEGVPVRDKIDNT